MSISISVLSVGIDREFILPAINLIFTDRGLITLMKDNLIIMVNLYDKKLLTSIHVYIFLLLYPVKKEESTTNTYYNRRHLGLGRENCLH